MNKNEGKDRIEELIEALAGDLSRFADEQKVTNHRLEKSIQETGDRLEILLEHMDDKIERLAEVTGGVNERLIRVEKDVAEIKAEITDYPIVKRVVQEHSAQLQDHDRQIATLKKQVA